LLLAAVDMPLEYDTEGRDGALATLLLHELAAAETLPLHVPLPPEPRWLALCEAFLVEPDIRASAERWAGLLHTSLRSFNRTFRRYTGLSFGAWKQRACVVQALARLAGGETVTAIALDCGYQSPAAFSTMFRRVLGQPPSAFQAGALRSPGGP
ncbi:helix-turn-helix domain-containing protein, partial [Pseudomonas aeruginosa]